MSDAPKSHQRPNPKSQVEGCTQAEAPQRRTHEVRAVRTAAGVIAGATTLWALALWAAIGVSNWSTPQPPQAAPLFHTALASRPSGPMLNDALVAQGREVFMMTCSKCHGEGGLGRPDLGKDLVHSDFVASRDDAAMRAFILHGRDVADALNTTKTAMPPKGADSNMSDDEVVAVVAYVRGLQDPRRLPMMKEWRPDDLEVAMAKMKAKAKECMGAEFTDGPEDQFELARGACCSQTGEGCILSTLADCGYSRMWIIGQPCSPSPCISGACCLLSTGVCASTIYSECEGVASWVPGRACEPNPCADPRRSVCCHTDGSCTIEVRDTCPGVFTPGSAACSASTCPQPTGACCSETGACAIATRAVCASLGTYRGHGTVCQTSQCELVAKAVRAER